MNFKEKCRHFKSCITVEPVRRRSLFLLIIFHISYRSINFADVGVLYHAKCVSRTGDAKLESGESLSRKFSIRRRGLWRTFDSSNSKLHRRRKGRSNTCCWNARLEDSSSKSHALSFDSVLGKLERQTWSTKVYDTRLTWLESKRLFYCQTLHVDSDCWRIVHRDWLDTLHVLQELAYGSCGHNWGFISRPCRYEPDVDDISLCNHCNNRSYLGGWFTMLMGVFSYIADITTEEERTLRIGFVNLCFSLGVPIGMAFSGVLLKWVLFCRPTWFILHFTRVRQKKCDEI